MKKLNLLNANRLKCLKDNEGLPLMEEVMRRAQKLKTASQVKMFGE
ncbi:MAG: hypothetical protein M3367_16480 [Acidobacteriota bacterium]|nr:hypothetical protein [Acidobacteriota bacterium]